MEQYKPRGGEHAASESSIKVSRDSKGWFSAGGLAALVRPCLLEHARMPDRSTTHTLGFRCCYCFGLVCLSHLLVRGHKQGRSRITMEINFLRTL